MKQKPVKVEKYGREVWANQIMDEIRKEECLCLNCNRLNKSCGTAEALFNICKTQNMALAVTRCLKFEANI